MIKILIVEDTKFKQEHIKKILESIPEFSIENLSIVSDLVEARNVLSRQFFDLLILDIFLPLSKGGKPTPESGTSFVRELRQSQSLIRPAHVIGLTAYDEAIKTGDAVFLEELWFLIKYDPSSSQWSDRLKSKVEYLLLTKKEMLTGDKSSFDFDLAIITALWEPEFNAVLNLPLNWNKRTMVNDGSSYYLGVPKNRVPNLKVVAASSSQMGNVAAAVLASKIIQHFKPRYLAMCGIAAGIKDANVNLGDILIAEQSWDYESGKRKQAGDKPVLLPDPHHIPISSELREIFAECTGKKHYVSAIRESWSGEKPDNALNAIMGPLASGDAVIEDSVIAENVKAHARKLIGIEMETYGVFYAAQNCCKPRPHFLSIKSVVDFADSEKRDLMHSYAAYTSAQYLWHFACDHIRPIS